MGIKSTLASLVSRREAQADATPDAGDSSADRLDLRLAPYTVTETSISIPRQREGGSRAIDDQR